jgi:hypothetical protein
MSDEQCVVRPLPITHYPTAVIISLMKTRMRRSQAGGALYEQLFAGAVVVLYCVLLVVAFNQSLALGFGMIGFTLVVAVSIFAFGYWHDRRTVRRREQGCRDDIARTATEHNAVIETLFIGRGEGGYAAFGVAGAARKLIHARESFEKDRIRVLEFDQLSAVFARPDGGERFRLEARVQPIDKGPQRAALFVADLQRDEAERWVQVLQPHLGERARFVESVTDKV